MVRSIKLLSYVAGCCGIVLLMLALVAMPPGLALADDPPPPGGTTDQSVLLPDAACAAHGQFAKNCIITTFPVDPCEVYFQTCNKSKYLPVCTCLLP